MSDSSNIRSYRPIGFFHAKKAISDLEKFLDLIRHSRNYAGDIKHARTLEELVSGYSKENKLFLLDREINRLIPVVIQHFRRSSTPMEYVKEYTDREYDFEKNIPRFVTKEEPFNLVMDYMQRHDQETYDLLTQNLERAIGYYRAVRDSSFKKMYKPIYWLAYIVRLPVTLVEKAGLQVDDSVYFKVYTQIVYTLMIFLLLLLATKLGLSIPWNMLLTRG